MAPHDDANFGIGTPGRNSIVPPPRREGKHRIAPNGTAAPL